MPTSAKVIPHHKSPPRLQHSFFKSAGFAVLCVLLSSLLFSCKAILVKYAFIEDAQLNGVNLLALRMVFALPFFILMVWLTEPQQAPKPADWAKLIIAGVAGYYLASVLDFIGLEYISASLERIILFLYPTLTVVLTAVLYKKAIGKTAMLALALSYGGTLVVMLVGHETPLSSSNMLLGVGLVFVSALCYASYLMLAEPIIEVFGKWHATGLVMTISAVCCIAHFLLVQDAPFVWLQTLSVQSYVHGALLGVFATVIPASLIIFGISKIGASQSAMISAGGPVLTLMLATAVLGESLNGWQWLGAAANIAGVLLIGLTSK